MICVKRKYVLAGGLVVAVLFAVLIGANFIPGSKNNPSVTKTGPESAQVVLNKLKQGVKPVVPRLNNDQVATLLLQWTNNTRTEKGGYASGEDCNGEGICAPLIVNNGVGATALWARHRFYLKHKNVDAMEIIRQDIKTYVDAEKVITIQPYFWNCKLLYEMWKSPALTQDEKYGLQTICARSIYNPTDLVPKTDPTPEAVIAQVKADLSGPAGTETFFGSPPEMNKLEEYAFNVSDRAAIYAWGKDQSDLEQAKLYFVAAMHALQTAPDRALAADASPMVGLAALDLNSVMPAPELQSYAEAVYNRFKGANCTRLQACVMRAYFYNELYKLNKKSDYKAQRDLLLNDMYDKQFDYQGTVGRFAEKQAYYDHGLNYSYDMIPNAMLAGLLLDL